MHSFPSVKDAGEPRCAPESATSLSVYPFPAMILLDRPEVTEETSGASDVELGRLLALFDDYAPVVKALLLRIVGDEEQTEELLAEVFAVAWENGVNLDGDPLSPLIEIGRERGLAWARANGGSAVGNECDEMKMLLPDSPVARLPVMQRQAVEYVFFAGGSIESFARKMHVPENWVSTTLLRAMSTLWTEQQNSKGPYSVWLADDEGGAKADSAAVVSS
jgi:DNA-directed RNA polymerase specialized sigma24 family protein